MYIVLSVLAPFFYFFVLCVLRISETSRSLPWKGGTLGGCFWVNIGNRVSAKNVGTMKCQFPDFFPSGGSGLNSVRFGGFLLGLAGVGNRIGLEQLNFVLVSFSLALPCFAGTSI